MKWFQEPFAYTEHFEKNQDLLRDEEWLYRSVEPICKYYVELRYTLMQLLYDTMFENQLTGLPIARALVLSPYFAFFFMDANGCVDCDRHS